MFGCGDDADPVAPTVTVTVPTPPTTPTPTPTPLDVKMVPLSQMIGVGNTIVFAVSVSGGVAGEAASWICDSSDLSKATVSDTPVGCAATAVAVGVVTITAVVTKGGETVNTAAGLTILEAMDEPELAITLVEDREGDQEILNDRVSVTLSVVPKGHTIMRLSVLVDGVVVHSLERRSASAVAAPEGELEAAEGELEAAEGEREALSRSYTPTSCRLIRPSTMRKVSRPT